MKTLISLHGIFLNIYNTGVLITGESGIGKSELALALVQRKHQLIADDITEFCVLDEDKILGRCPQLLQGFLAIYGIGVLNIPKLFGSESILSEQFLSLIIHLTEEVTCTPALENSIEYVTVLDKKIPQIKLSILQHRHLDILIETLVRHHQLRQMGYDAGQEFVQQQQDQLT
jgi:HPr kinase/phosphorylase